jgi:shikimate dehydrogenase
MVEFARAIEEAVIIINATPVGMSHVGSARLIGDDSWIKESQVCFDFVYQHLPTPFLADAERRGARTLSGLALLVSQAQAGFRLWTGKEFPLYEMYRAVELEHIKHREKRRHANEIFDSR